MSEQLVFELAPPEPPTFANFVVGPNAEAVTALTRLANGTAPETGLVVWGATTAGKTHLLRATVRASAARGRAATYVSHPGALTAADLTPLSAEQIVAVDDVDAADAVAQGLLFTLYNALKAAGAHLVVGARVPPAQMQLRDDLRTRLGWGLVYELVPLADADKPAALIAYARERGFSLAPEIVRHLLVHGRRDMASLLATLAALDRHSLATKRPITIPMLREWLQRDLHRG